MVHVAAVAGATPAAEEAAAAAAAAVMIAATAVAAVMAAAARRVTRRRHLAGETASALWPSRAATVAASLPPQWPRPFCVVDH